MNSPGLVVSCTSPASASGHELAQWLTKTIAALGPGQASLYLPTGTERVWLVTISGDAASDSSRMSSLLTEMRLLGLKPNVFRQAGAPAADLAAAR